MNRRSFLGTFLAPYAAKFVPVHLNPWRTPTVGQISRATFKFWRNQSADGQHGPNLNAQLMRDHMQHIYQECR